MKLFLMIISLFGFLSAQDEYPFFSDPLKQMEFEEKRIYINEVDEKEMEISGGSKLNLFFLLDQSQPAFVPGNVETSYNYIYKFEIIQNGKNLSELDLLYEIGLEEKAQKLFQTQVDSYKKQYVTERVPKSEINFIDSTYHDGKIVNFTTFKKYYLISISMMLGGGISSSYNLNKNIINFQMAFGFFGICFTFLFDRYPSRKVTYCIPFAYKQSLTNSQLQSLAESYNRRIFDEIKNRP